MAAQLSWTALVNKLHTMQAFADVAGENIDDLNGQVTAMREISKLPPYLQQVEEKYGDEGKWRNENGYTISPVLPLSPTI